ncbi:MAG: threonine/serine dehydratase [Planctomycetes bacterium]|nr:threonine/serine dehydratase [Planctomycetota bacterium]
MEPITLAEIKAAADRLRGHVVHTPLMRIEGYGPIELWIKPESLQPIGSFKLRGAGNALMLADPDGLRDGVVTASAGNMAQGVAWWARRMGIPCRVIVPERAPRTKIDAIARLGAESIPVPYDRWWRTLVEGGHEDVPGFFVHPVSERSVIAGNATVGLEILEDLPAVDTILVPYGGGGLATGVACAAKAIRPGVKVLACEVETAAPLTASLAADRPVAVDHQASFVDGIGGKSVLAEMWPLARAVIDGTVVVTLREIADAIRLLAERAHLVAEGAGAASVAGAVSGRIGGGHVACVLSGANIDPETFATILAGDLP